MSITPSVRDLLEGHISLELESIDRAQAAELAQLLHGDGLIQAGQDLLDALESRRFSTGFRDRGVLRCDRQG